MYIKGIVDSSKRGFSVRELLGETEFTKLMAKWHGIKYEVIK